MNQNSMLDDFVPYHICDFTSQIVNFSQSGLLVLLLFLFLLFKLIYTMTLEMIVDITYPSEGKS